jgi:hypothetical protein
VNEKKKFTLGCALAGGLVCAAHAQEHGKLLGVTAGGDAAASAIELVGDRPLSFTTLKLSGPPRVVVDFADTDVSGAPEELVVEDGTIHRVAIAEAGSRTARVVIELTADAEFDVRAHGSSIEVRVPRIAPMLAKLTPKSKPPPKPAALEAQKRASLPTVALVGSRPNPGPAAAARRKALDERVAQYLEDQRAAAEKSAALRKSNQDAKAAAQRAAAETAAARQADSARAADDRRAAAEKQRLEKRLAARSLRPQRKIALAEAPRHAITGIGFRPNAGGEVIVRSDQPLEYGVTGDDHAILLHLPRAGIPLLNNRRPLDTRFFNGPVDRVVPVTVPGGTDVRIELRRHAEYQLAQSGSVLTVTFSAPKP